MWSRMGGGGVYSWTDTSQLANGYIPSNLAENIVICHMWHHILINQNLRLLKNMAYTDQMTINALNMLLLNENKSLASN